MNFSIFLYNTKSFNIIQSTQFNQDLQIECVAKLASSQLIEASLNGLQACKSANYVTLMGKTELTPSIARFRFRLKDPCASGAWKPGQHATLSFTDHLDICYSHMLDDGPKSLNDDYLRAFCRPEIPDQELVLMKKKRLYIHGAKRPPDDRNVEDDCDLHLTNAFAVSSPPSKRSPETGKLDEEFKLTIRKVGRATEYLFGQDPGFEVPLRGFEGEEAEWWHCSIYCGWR